MNIKIQNRKHNKGFTLIEILIAVAIIGTMSAIVLVATGNSGPKSRATADLASLRQLQQNVDLFVSQYGSVSSTWGTSLTPSTTAQKTAMITSLIGQAGGTDTTLDTFAASNPTMVLTESLANTVSRFNCVYISTPSPGRVVILQYRKNTGDLVVNGDGTVTPAATGFVTTTLASASAPFGQISGSSTAWPY